MTRPTIVRADTIDLQDPDAPHAAEHNKHINGDSIAPHQASQYQQVAEERHTEEQILADAWAMSGDGTSEPTVSQSATDDDKIEQDAGENGVEGADGDDGDQDADDDLMDRISSSPSIDDGEYNTASSMRNTLHTYGEGNLNIPLRQSSLPRSGHFALLRREDGSSTWLHQQSVNETPVPNSVSPLLATATLASLLSGDHTHHQREGRYTTERTKEAHLEALSIESAMPEPITRNAFRFITPIDIPSVSHLASTIARPQAHGALLRDTRASSITSLNMEDLLLPENDPLLSPTIRNASPTDSWASSEDDNRSAQDEEESPHSQDDDRPLSALDHCVDSGSSDVCLPDTEDIDFEFVYALHTFVATVEGQANATKGDTMVLLDDSNSYWWLVRVVKDSSIGYLPAEHIETPTERLARLNKHRNIDLSQSMLGDNPEKSRNPLKIAMRRRNAKTVQFAAPTYVEASDYDYSDDEEQPGNDSFTNGTPVDDPAVNGQPAEVEERNAPEEANVHATRRHSGDQASIASKNSFDSTHKQSFDGAASDDPQLSPKLVDRTEAAPLKSRKGTPRNTDSFLKDDSIETRKITLTPGLLREDGANNNSSKSSSIDSQRNPSMESLTKVTPPSETSSTTPVKKESKDKKKEKQKGGMLSGLFKSKKKDKKNGKDDEGSDERPSIDTTRTGSPQQNGSSSPVERSTSVVAAAAAAGRDVQVQSRNPPNGATTPQQAVSTPQQTQGSMMAELQGSEAAYEMVGTVPDQATDKLSVSNLLKQAPKAKRAKQRVELDDFDSPQDVNPFSDPDEDAPMMSPSGTITDGADFVHIPMSFNDDEEDDVEEMVPEKDVKETPTKPGILQRTRTDGGIDVFSDARETVVSPTPQREEHTYIQQPTTAAPAEAVRGNSTSSRSSSAGEADTPNSASVLSHDSKHTWDDGALRAWLDAEEVKDMLTIVHSSAHANGPIQPASDDHPLMRGLYAEERSSVGRMMSELDTLLMGFASRKGLA